MKKDRAEIENLITIALRDSHSTNKAKELKENMKIKLDKYFRPYQIIQIVNGNTLPATLNDSQLYIIAEYLVSQKYIDISLDEYYHESEVSKAVSLVNKSFDFGEKLELKDVIRVKGVAGEQFIASVPYSLLAQAKEAGLFNYNFETQRKAKIIKRRGRTERVATINKDNVEAIKQAILDGTFETNTITLNIRKDTGYKYEYSPASRSLSIDLNHTELDTIDGEHRQQGILAAYLEDPTIEGNMILSIKNLSIDDARYFIAQEAKGTLNNQEEMILYDTKSSIASLIADINKFRSRNILFNGIKTGNDARKPFVFYEIFSKNLYEAWNSIILVASQKELINIRDFIVKFYAIAYESIMEKNKVDSIDELGDTIARDHMFISGLLYPASTMYEKCEGIIGNEEIEKIESIVKYATNNEANWNKYVYEDGCARSTFDMYKMNWKKLYK